MSTFDGIVKEFPDIRIDHFRSSNEQSQPPLALFLSHVHSDHLVGLESCKSPFIYCSPATRELLLRLEKYPHRMNFAKGILESRKQTYRHLKTLLKPIPLETPTKVILTSITSSKSGTHHCIIHDRVPSISLDDSYLKEQSIQNENTEERFANFDDLPLERLVPRSHQQEQTICRNELLFLIRVIRLTQSSAVW
ncbi:hypothetical protein KC315_g3110 [Hortaea werneckii]|nr:hypothetical protein KC315_g3110 [Hortaea werneckii]